MTAKSGFRAGGVVYDTEGRPIPGSRVLFDWIAVHADDVGRYAFDVLGPPPWHRCVDAPGYAWFEDPPLKKGGGDGDFRLRRRSLIVEPVDARTGAPLPAARGVLTRAGTGAPAGVLVPKFRLRIPDWVYPPGRLYLDPVPDLGGGGRAEFDVHVFLPAYLPRVARIALAPDAEPPHLRVELEPGVAEAVLAGRVEGASSATVEIREADHAGMMWNEDMRPLLQTAATDEGEFEIVGLPPGKYRMTVRAEGKGVVARDIDVPARDVVVQLEATASLIVIGTDPDAAPVAGAWIHVEAADGGTIREERTDANGRATFRDLPAGKLLLCPARFQGSSARSKGVPLEEFEIPAGGTEERRIEVPLERDFVLGVVDDKGIPVAGVTVAVRPRTGYGWVFHNHPGYRPQADTNARGEVVFRLYPGTYEAAIVRDGTNRTSSFTAGANRSHRIVLESTLVLRGRVVDATTGDAIREIQVALAAEGEQIGKTLTDKDGRFAIACAGVVKLLIRPYEGPEGTQWSETPYPYWVEREIDAAALPAGELRIALPKVRGPGADVPVAVEVVATDASTGSPIDGARVGVIALRDGLRMASGDQVVSGSDGCARCRTMRGERYEIWVSGPDGTALYERWKLEREGGADEIRIAAALERKPK